MSAKIVDMNWLELVEHPKAVTTVFNDTPSLKSVEIISVLADRDGPTATIEIALNQPPAKLPQRWQRIKANAATLKLQLLGVESLVFSGWASENQGDVDIREGRSNEIIVQIKGATTRFKCRCRWMRIAGLTGYRRGP
jgi:hypothetical protein